MKTPTRSVSGAAAALCLLFALCALLRPFPAHGAEDGTEAPPPLALFGAVSKAAYPMTQMSDSGPIARWRAVMEHHHGDDAFAPGNTAMNAPMRRQWETLVARSPNMTPEERLRAVNAFFNRIPGVSDALNYGQEEYWAYPAEFIRKNGGDCEDYALAKYLALRRLGVPDKDLRLVLVKDLQRGSDHAVLAVSEGGRILILDNLSRPKDLIMPQDKLGKIYSPMLAINNSAVWNFSLSVKRRPKAAR